jgi:hypothetical protein
MRQFLVGNDAIRVDTGGQLTQAGPQLDNGGGLNRESGSAESHAFLHGADMIEVGHGQR